MKLSVRLSSCFSGDWSGSRRRDKRDAVVILGILSLTYVVGTAYDWAIKLFRFAVDHENWYIDDLLFMAFVLGLAMIVYGFRRYKDVSREIKARITAESEARNLARHDPLTGLPNRRFFAEKLDECLSHVSQTQRAAVLMLDLDGFKLINDTHGHAIGDEALREFAQRVSTVLRADNILARIGGDEFGIITPKIVSLDDPTNLARRIGSAVADPFIIGNVTAELGVGIGIAIAPDDGIHLDELVRRADRALYRAKAAGRSSVRFFETEMDAHVERRIQIESDLRSAIASHGIVPYYQPLVSLDGNLIIGFEALARWQNGDMGFVPPRCVHSDCRRNRPYQCARRSASPPRMYRCWHLA